MALISRTLDKIGVAGSIVSAMACPACFPAVATLGGAIGLGFLSQWESLFLTTLLPLFAVIVLVANAAGGLRHRLWWRALAGVIGPVLVLLGIYSPAGPWLLYLGLASMAAMAVFDIVAPARPVCRTHEQRVSRR